MKRLLALLLVLALGLSGCAQTAGAPEEIPDQPMPEEAGEEPAPEEEPVGPARIGSLEELLAAVNEEHRAITKPEVDSADYIHEESENPNYVFDYLEGPVFDGEATLTQEQVEADMEVLFQALRTTYGPYHYFGGDDAFFAAKEAVIADCAAEGEMTGARFEEILLERLQFVGDAHLWINQKGLAATALPYFYTQMAFLRGEEGYCTGDGAKTVAAVEGWEDLDRLFRRSLTGAGEVVYYPVVLAEETPGSLEVTYTDGSTQMLEPTPWKSQYDDSERTVEWYENEGYPVLFSRNMGFDHAQDDFLHGRELLEALEELKEKPVLIMDLRSNGGGNGIMPLKWLSEYAGERVTTNYVSFQYWTLEGLRQYGSNTENPYYIPYDELIYYEGYEEISPNYLKLGDLPEIFVPNDRLLIVLTGKNTGSAAETFVDAARNVENTLIVGENTYGMLVSNAYITIKLPESGVAVQLGSDLCVFPEGGFAEYVGFEPDLWVSGDAEAAVIAMLQNWYGD